MWHCKRTSATMITLCLVGWPIHLHAKFSDTAWSLLCLSCRSCSAAGSGGLLARQGLVGSSLAASKTGAAIKSVPYVRLLAYTFALSVNFYKDCTALVLRTAPLQRFSRVWHGVRQAVHLAHKQDSRELTQLTLPSY